MKPIAAAAAALLLLLLQSILSQTAASAARVQLVAENAQAQQVLQWPLVQLALDKLEAHISQDVSIAVTVGNKTQGEGYVLQQQQPDQLSLWASGGRGVSRALFDLASHCRRQTKQDYCVPEQLQADEPSFNMRVWSEEGQMLDLSDRGYWTDQPPYINTTRLQAECQVLLDEARDFLAPLGYTGLVVLLHDVESFVLYDGLLANPVYPPDDPQRQRVAAARAIVANFTEQLHNLNFTLYFQPYEVEYPQQLAGHLNLTAFSPDLERLLVARYTEFFRFVPADGIIVTVEDSWSPRAGVIFNVSFSTPQELAAVANAFYAAVQQAAGRDLIIRTWFVNPQFFPYLIENTPPDLAWSAKQTAGDFILNQPLNPAFAPGGFASQRRFMVVVDAFREYNGWTSTTCYMAQWPERLQAAHAAGATMLNVWGDWSEGCTWPDSGQQLVNGSSSGYKSWIGIMNSYRVFAPTATNGGFALGPRANAQLAAALGLNVSRGAAEVAGEFASEYFGQVNVQTVVQLLMQSEDLWYAALDTGPYNDFLFQWTVVMNPQPLSSSGPWQSFFDMAPAQIVAQRQNVTSRAQAFWQTALQVNAGQVPDPVAYSGLLLSANKTQLYVTTFTWFKETTYRFLHLQHDPQPSAANCTDAAAALSTTVTLVNTWAAYPQEAAQWQILYRDPNLASRPDFFHQYMCMMDWLVQWQQAYPTLCKGWEVRGG